VTDIPARAFASVFSKSWGSTVVVKNVTGASGVTGCAEVAHARPDG
jgi:tripartite-type tricarboxylate transporter receptor subunit TctC